MKRRFTSQDGVEWEAESTPVQPERAPRAKFALIDDVPWRIQFTSDRRPTESGPMSRPTPGWASWIYHVRSWPLF